MGNIMTNIIVGNITFSLTLLVFAYLRYPKFIMLISVGISAFSVILVFFAMIAVEYLGDAASLIGSLTKVIGWYPSGPDVWFPAGAAIWFATIFAIAFLSLSLGRTLRYLGSRLR